jgi:uncharacterized membrane protein YhaH (DUF805 family)
MIPRLPPVGNADVVCKAPRGSESVLRNRRTASTIRRIHQQEIAMHWYMRAVSKYAHFGGRAHRMEYWMFVLVDVSIATALWLVAVTLGLKTGGMTSLSGLYGLGLMIPRLAACVRRLHDTGRSGWWLLIALVPIIGAIALLVMLAQDGNAGANEYGPNPKEAAGYA